MWSYQTLAATKFLLQTPPHPIFCIFCICIPILIIISQKFKHQNLTEFQILQGVLVFKIRFYLILVYFCFSCLNILGSVLGQSPRTPQIQSLSQNDWYKVRVEMSKQFLVLLESLNFSALPSFQKEGIPALAFSRGTEPIE